MKKGKQENRKRSKKRGKRIKKGGKGEKRGNEEKEKGGNGERIKKGRKMKKKVKNARLDPTKLEEKIFLQIGGGKKMNPNLPVSQRIY